MLPYVLVISRVCTMHLNSLLGFKAFCEVEEDILCNSDNADDEQATIEKEPQRTLENKENVLTGKKAKGGKV